MNDTVEYHQKLILEKLYIGFMSNPPNRINNIDIERVFTNIRNNTNFNIARELLSQKGFLEGNFGNYGNIPFMQMAGEGIIYFEKTYIIPNDKRTYLLLASKLLTFLRDIGDSKYDIKKYIVDSDSRTIKVEIPLSDIEEILKHDYNYNLNVLKWRILYFTSQFISKHIMGINGIGIGNDILSFHNPNSFCLNGNGYNFLNEVFFIEKFQKIGNYDGRSRVTQLYNDLSVWISKNRWVDVAINMGAIIEYCIDNYVEIKSLKEFFKKGKLIDNFNQKLNIILQNPTSNPDDIFNPQHRATWKRMDILKDWRNFIHISKLVIERSPLDEKSIKNFYDDFELTLNLLLNL